MNVVYNKINTFSRIGQWHIERSESTVPTCLSQLYETSSEKNEIKVNNLRRSESTIENDNGNSACEPRQRHYSMNN